METATTMAENTSSNSSNSSQHEEINSTRQSSKLSLGSSPSVLSADEQLDGEGPLTPTEKLQDSDDDLSALNSILQAGSPGSLSNEEVSEEEEEEENDSASPLSSVPDDFPLSRSNSPELEAINNNKKRRKELVDAHMHPIKKSKMDHQQEELIKKRRASRSITANILSSVSSPSSSRPRRRASRQEQKDADDQLMEDEEEDEVSEEEREDEDEEEGDDEEEEEEENSTNGKKESEGEPEEEKKEEPLVEDTVDKETKKEEDDGSADKINNDTPVGLIEDLEGDGLDCQQRHKEALDALTHIEIEFARLRDKMYQEKMSELNEEAIMIANGTHPELVTLMAEIEEKKGKRISSAEAWRRHQHANFRQQFEGFEYQANIHFISQKNALRRNLLSSINNKKWNIEDERTKLNDPARTDKMFPDGREMVVNKREQKEETGELQDIKEAIGFPMAPNPTGLSLQDVDEDLKLLGVIHRP